MPFGIRTWDASGNLVIDLSQRISRVLGQQQLWAATGSINDPNIALGSFWWDFPLQPASGHGWIWSSVPAISLSGTTISWSGADTSGAWLLRWGIY